MVLADRIMRQVYFVYMKKETGIESCSLCGSDKTEFFFEDKYRTYFQCGVCKLVIVPAAYWLSLDEEKSEYDLHENDVESPGYRRFLSRLSVPLCQRLRNPSKGLDFGCGPGPLLSIMMREAGHHMRNYDPFYINEKALLKEKYDFICATEVVEHLKKPAVEFHKIFDMLNDKGILAIMTKMVIDKEAFSGWHYIQDQTHICFYSHETFEFIARRFNTSIEFVGKDVVFFKRL